MWFNILKLDLKNLKNQIQPDVEGESININASKKCKDKIKRFEDNLYNEFGYDSWKNTGFIADEVPEKVYCLMVENIDKFFKQEFREEDIPNLTEKRLKARFLEYPNNYLFFMFSSKGNKRSQPFIMTLYLPKRLHSINKYEFDMEFDDITGDEDYSRTTELYEKIKSCWERA